MQGEGRYFAVWIDPADRPGCFAGKPYRFPVGRKAHSVGMRSDGLRTGRTRDIYIVFLQYIAVVLVDPDDLAGKFQRYP
jgi:hypothetical protein